MKLITLNIWGGKVFDPLMEFFRSYASDIDIFCLQEVFNNPSGVESRVWLGQDKKQDVFQDIIRILEGFDGYMAPAQEGEESLAMFVKKNLAIGEMGEEFVYRWKNAMEGSDASTYGVNVQHLKFTHGKKNFMVNNLHGHWTPDFKGDNQARLEQSRNIARLLEGFSGAKILCGDFNVAPDTKSMAILEESMRNLVKEYGVATTRSSYYTKKHKFADYILVSPEVKVLDFKVLWEPVSDHLPLYLEFE